MRGGELRRAARGLVALLTASSALAATAEVRVNQLGYEAGAKSRAYLMSDTAETGATFKLIQTTGGKVFSGAIGASLGSWGAFQVYALDFQTTNIGTFRIEVKGPVPATSPAFPIDTPAQIYAQGIPNALNFYQVQRDGANFIPGPLRTAAGHLNDANAKVYKTPKFDGDDNIIGDLDPTGAVIDASGGWWDAGDYVKFVETHSYTVALMLIGIRDFPNQMGSSAGAADFTAEAKFGLDWLLKMWDDSSRTLYYQVGNPSDFASHPNILGDHDIWRLPQVDDTLGGNDPTLRFIRHRPVFLAGKAGSKISPNLAGRLAASFAGCYQVFRQTHPNYAGQCLAAAEHVFDLADTSPNGDLLTVAPFDDYGETEWRDDMELGATELYFALRMASHNGAASASLPHTDPGFYLKTAAQWAHAYITGPNDNTDTLNLYDVSGLAHFELYRAISVASDPDGLAVSKPDLLKDLKLQLDTAIGQGATDPFGFGYPWAVYDTATHGAGLAVMAKEYAAISGSGTYDSYSRRWMANILGANAWGSSVIVGDGTTFPNCMQHQVTNIIGSLDGTFPVLNGALVEGPNSFAATGQLDGMRDCPAGGTDKFAAFNANGAIFQDNVQSYSTVEPAIDLTAASFLMFAWRMAGEPSVLFQE